MASKWIRKHQNILIEILCLTFAVLVIIVSLILYLTHAIRLEEILSVSFLVVVSFIPIYYLLVKRKNQALLISYTARYLLSSDDTKIDHLLGLLIADQWDKIKLDPVEEFFTCLKGIIEKDNYEMKRRISEALPALFAIDLEEAQGIADILRRDWDRMMKSDNRRRTIESLPCILKKDKDYCKKTLELMKDDEIFTIIAIIEVLILIGEEIYDKERERLFNALLDRMDAFNYRKEEIEAVSVLWKILNTLHFGTIKEALTIFEANKHDPNIYVQIGLARNLKFFFETCPNDMLNFMNFFIGSDRHKYVRMPIAKEDNTKCIVNCLCNRKYNEDAKKIIRKLLNDEEEIIRVTTFDRIENILAADKTFAKEILDSIITKHQDLDLVVRAKTVLSTYNLTATTAI